MADLVRLAVNGSRLEAAAGKPSAEALAVVVAARLGAGLHHRQSANLAAPMHHSRVEQSALLEVGHQRGGRSVGAAANAGERAVDVFVIVPRLAVEEQLHKTHAALDQAPGDQAARAVFTGGVLVDAVQFFRRRAFAVDVERLRGGGLHSGGQFVAVDARLESVFAGALGQVGFVELAEKVEVVELDVALQLSRCVEVENTWLFRAQHRALIQARQEAVGPVVHAIDRVAAGVGQHHVSRQLVRLAA